jgi:hypothetical protein
LHAVICTGKLTNQNWEYYKVNDNIRCLFLIASTHTEKTELAINVNDPNAGFSPKRESEEQGMTRLITCCISQSIQEQILKYLKLKWTLPLLRLVVALNERVNTRETYKLKDQGTYQSKKGDLFHRSH